MENIQKLLASHYSRLYSGKEKHDSPDLARTRMCNEIVRVIKDEPLPNNQILSIGSGRQALEKQLLVSRDPKTLELLKNTEITTIDIANISKSKLLALKYGINHVQANTLNLPFQNNTFGLIFSNLAIDFAPKEALKEAFRVLSPKGKVLFNFHHPILYTKNTQKSPEEVKQFISYIKENRILYENKESIEYNLINSGFKHISVSLDTDGEDKWWMVRADKE
jgi:ubiquinone/menaquinone biosynthesis C-methylase UbiE